MKLQTQNGTIKSGSLFKLAATGYAIGAAAIFVPLFTLVALFTLPTITHGMPVTGALALVPALAPLVALPLVLALQAVMFGLIATLGLWLYSRRRPIEIIED